VLKSLCTTWPKVQSKSQNSWDMSHVNVVDTYKEVKHKQTKPQLSKFDSRYLKYYLTMHYNNLILEWFFSKENIVKVSVYGRVWIPLYYR